ncbi:low molecular weight protein tyrosine phosphatase family protein [Burkholderia sp. BCC0322]|uniref:low molecular weight protein tyrosine phosphatase family protein n=1 Tax=unclassified Burkholderia TaxID=2613784 RepID=UPI00158B5D62|nr:low molecular weight protein tyrosine phosphatase family protein [Burkholderia sp. BCC0322]
MTRALFICSRNRLRSPTAEAVFAAWPAVETDSAGLAPDADTRLSAEQLDWADVVFVMERAHRARLAAQFGTHLRHKKIVCLDIPDRYTYMQPELVTLLERKAGPFLRA